MEERVVFSSGEIELEGLFHGAAGAPGAVITHPHPLYGGDMRNPVVETAARAYQKLGYATLRFNFRGEGGSDGRHDGGEGERADVRAALAFLAEKGARPVDLVGYSFGAWVNALACGEGAKPDRMVMISPPVAFIDFRGIAELPMLELVITGSEDEIAPPAEVEKMKPVWRPDATLEIIPGADHFYSGRARALEDLLESTIPRFG
ncbi:MAG: alpha/beta fold hydrolase [Desulfobacterales bacterium]|nr:alpha/beta fold hydrolase [Desulfobacterales bacterium]